MFWRADKQYFLTYFFQSLPEGEPTFVPPSLDRIDIKKLQSDAYRYREKCGISEEDEAWWLEHLKQLQEYCITYPLSSPVWSLPELKSFANSRQIRDEISTVNIPEIVQNLQQKEQRPHPEVRKKVILY